MNGMTSILKDRMIFLGWIAGLVLIASLLWSFSFPFRSHRLMRSTNRILVLMDDNRRLGAPLLRPFVEKAPLGCWYRLYESDSLFFVFTIMKGGILVPCGAEISKEGKIVEIIPLGSHARQVMGRIPQGVIQVYVHRIESVVAAVLADAPERGGR